MLYDNMIVINKGAENTVVLTLYEKTTLTDYTYQFTFRNETTKEERVLELEDNSEYQYRYNLFVIDEGSTTDLTFDVGEWTYTVEAVNDEDSEVVETGIMQVKESATTDTTYQTTNTNTTYNG